jgi:hypothetical protein
MLIADDATHNSLPIKAHANAHFNLKSTARTQRTRVRRIRARLRDVQRKRAQKHSGDK